MFWRLLTIEHRKIFRRWTLRIEILLVSTLLLLVYIINLINLTQTLAWRGRDNRWVEELKISLTWPAFVDTSIQFSGIFGIVMVIVLVGSMTAQEFTWRTVSLQVGHGAPRLPLVTAKFLSFLLPMLCLILIPLATGGIASYIATLQFNGGMPPAGLDFSRIAAMILLVEYAFLLYASLTFFLAVLTRSAAAAIGIALGYLFIVEAIFSGVLTALGGNNEKVAAHLPGVMASKILGLLQSGENLNLGALPKEFHDPILGVTVYIVIFFLLSVWIFRQRDMGT